MINNIDTIASLMVTLKMRRQCVGLIQVPTSHKCKCTY